jgi:hypothetical protein
VAAALRLPFFVPARQFLKPSNVATSQLGDLLPRPHPPEPFVCATSGPAHLPVLKPQQPCWHSLSFAHAAKTTFLPLFFAASCAMLGAFLATREPSSSTFNINQFNGSSRTMTGRTIPALDGHS